MRKGLSVGLVALMATTLVACGQPKATNVEVEDAKTSTVEMAEDESSHWAKYNAENNKEAEAVTRKSEDSNTSSYADDETDNKADDTAGNMVRNSTGSKNMDNSKEQKESHEDKQDFSVEVIDLDDKGIASTSPLNYTVSADNEAVFNERLNQCLAAANQYTRKVDKEKAVHDWIILNCHYDTSENHPRYAYTPEGVFVYGNAVCDGYTKAMKLCMDKLGVECTRVVGYAHGQLHSWNNIKLDDGCWYELDVTWDDPLPDVEGRISYQYFNVTSAYMRKTHRTDESYECTATQYSYWNAYATQVYVSDYEKYLNLMTELINGGKDKVTLALEYREFLSIDNLRNYYYFYERTGKNCYFDICQVYEDGGNTTHFPNGTIVVEVTFYYGEFLDGYSIKYISNQNEYDSIIKGLPINESEQICISIKAENFAQGNYTREHLSELTTKQISSFYVEKVSDLEYVIWIELYASEEWPTVTTLEGIDGVVDSNMAGGQDEFSLIYVYGENSARTDLIKNRIGSRLMSQYGIPDNGYRVDFYSVVDRGYRVEVNIVRR